MDQVTDPTQAHILLVEDDPGVARLTAAILGNEGFSVDVLRDQEAALPQLAESAYALVIADTNSGARSARLDDMAPLIAASKGCPVLLFSAHRFRPADIAAAGFAGVIHKPYDLDDMLRVVHRNLREVASATP